ncbi:uncharacterized protein B0H18DRAFT_877822 [Fomitopsis serialis]|uniref:uncharacterized protein n=1 Tax=Fomitopsis serialis TaxID=139415 RepID=UPI0020073F99|nr:uncharacterized protein B0H18DRAFT_877822 [Neoantrodia serialis]KAH9924500.1 hypothetical protein B0H18DRAFT_877822 [Neoantrodia serialis]
MPHINFPDVDGDDGDDDDHDDDDDDGGSGRPEDEPLALPSDFSAAERNTLGLEAQAVFERRVRHGRAYDLLAAVKESINHQGAFLEDKQKHARGQKDNTRSQKQVSNATARTRMLAGLYNYNRDRLIALSDGIAEDVLQAINMETDLKSKNWRKPRQQGDSREERAWIWTHGNSKASGSSIPIASTNNSLVDRVQWFRARAEVKRVNEEINKLHAEFKRTILGFKNMSRAWEQVSAKAGLSDGARAYALRKVNMFNKLSVQCADVFGTTRKDAAEKWDYSIVSSN